MNSALPGIGKNKKKVVQDISSTVNSVLLAILGWTPKMTKCCSKYANKDELSTPGNPQATSYDYTVIVAQGRKGTTKCAIPALLRWTQQDD